MPTDLRVEVVEIENVIKHPDADKLEIAKTRGWEVVIGKDTFKKGDKAVYFPLDSILPIELSEKIGVTKYLHKQRVVGAKLRGIVSFGLLYTCEDLNWEIGKDLTKYYGVTKYEPTPIFNTERKLTTFEKFINKYKFLKYLVRKLNKYNPFRWQPEQDFIKYTDIENLRNYPNVLKEGEPVVITEKIHGSNMRIGIINGKFKLGSHNTERRIDIPSIAGVYIKPIEKYPAIKNLLLHLKENGIKKAIIFGEIFGKGIQTLEYGTRGQIDFKAFDIWIDGKYIQYDKFVELCHKFEIPMVPLLYSGPFSIDKIKELSIGKTTINGGEHTREGVVIKPEVERYEHRVGRVILKYISDEYLLMKHKISDSH